MSGPHQHAVIASTVFDGIAVHSDCAVVVEGSTIVAVLPASEVSQSIQVRSLPEVAWLAPGFIDLQVNGGGDVLFNDEPNVEGIDAIAAAHRRFGTTGLLPTLISDTTEKMRAGREAVQKAASFNPGVLGIHFEGPWLSPEKRGVHDAAMIRSPDAQDSEFLASARDHVTVVTLAPECVPGSFIPHLVRSRIRVSLGHSMATYAETRVALGDGLTGFTHLFNAMRPLGSREPGPIAAALEAESAFFGMIVDCVHVDAAMLRLALRGKAHPMLVTDAMPPVGGGKTDFVLYGRPITVRNGRCTTEEGMLAGAALDMATAVRNCVKHLGIALPDALRFASSNPASFIGLGNTLGRLAPGYRADMVAFRPNDIGILATWVAGVESESR